MWGVSRTWEEEDRGGERQGGLGLYIFWGIHTHTFIHKCVKQITYDDNTHTNTGNAPPLRCQRRRRKGPSPVKARTHHATARATLLCVRVRVIVYVCA